MPIMREMVVLFALFAAVLAACGLGLAGVGIAEAIGTHLGAGLMSIGMGLLVSYGGYLFGRAAARTRRELRENPPTPVEKRSRRSRIGQTLGFVAIMALGSLGLPLPTGVRVISLVGAVLVLPLFLVVDFEPPKRRRQPPSAR